MSYTYSSNVTIKEIKRILEIMEETNEDVVSLHFTDGSGIGASIRVGGTGKKFHDTESYENITDYAAF